MSQPASRRVAGLHLVTKATRTETTKPTAVQVKSRGRARTTRRSTGAFMNGTIPRKCGYRRSGWTCTMSRWRTRSRGRVRTNSKERRMKVANAVAQILKKEGVEFLIGYPVNQIIEAAAQADIRTIIVRQERTGLHMADAVSRVTSADRIGVFAMQHGPGAENSFGGVAQAYGDSVPIVVLPGGYPRRITNVAPNFNSALNYRHVTKWIEQVTTAETIPDVMRRAFTQVRNGRPRPVLVEIPVDLWADDVAEPINYVPALRTRFGPDPKAVSEVAAVLVGAERPVIYAGQGVHYAKAWSQLRELAELRAAPVTTSLQGKS